MTRSLDQALLQGADVSPMANMNMAINGFNLISNEVGANSVNVTSNTGKYVTDQSTLQNISSFNALYGQQVSNPFPSVPAIKKGLLITAGAAYTTLAAGDMFLYTQPLEGNRISKLAWGTSSGLKMTVGFFVRPSYNMTGYAFVANGATGTRVFFRRFVAPANVDTFVPLSFDPEPTGVWNTDNTNGMTFGIALAAGTNRVGTPDTWLASGTVYAGADCSNIGAVAGSNVIVSGLVMLPGVVPISKEIMPLLARSQAQENIECLRYWAPVSMAARVNMSGSSFMMVPFYLPVPMRAIPSATLISAGSQSNVTSYSANLMSVSDGFLQITNQYTQDTYVFNMRYAMNARM